MTEPTLPDSMADIEPVIHSAALSGEDKVLVFVEANAEITHVLALVPDAARRLVVGLLDALDVVALTDKVTEQ